MKIIPLEKVRGLLRQALWLLLGAAFLVTVGFADHRRKDILCTGLEIFVHDSAGNAFIERSDVFEMVRDKFGNPAGRPLSSINMALLEKIINGNAYVARAEVFSTVDGKLTIEVVQRNPVLRIINSSNESFCIDDEGVFMPLSDAYTANVAVANGFITTALTDRKIRVFTPGEAEDTSLRLTLTEQLFALNRYIGDSEFWNAQIEQVYVNNEQEFELVPRMGNHTVLFGDTRDMDEKFDKLLHFYREGLNRTGWNEYQTINIKYKEQVVCTKK